MTIEDSEEFHGYDGTMLTNHAWVIFTGFSSINSTKMHGKDVWCRLRIERRVNNLSRNCLISWEGHIIVW